MSTTAPASTGAIPPEAYPRPTPGPSTVDACPEGDPYLFSVDDFYRMVDLDIFPEGNRTGLWDGRIYEKPAKTLAHAVTEMKLISVLYRVLPPGWFLSADNSLTIGPDRAPSPDMAAIRGKPDDYLDRRPDSADAGLVIEMADEILRNDVGRKLAAYTGAGIPSYWVLNLKEYVIHVHSDPIPEEGRYASMATVKPGESFPFQLGGVPVGPIAASDLLPIR